MTRAHAEAGEPTHRFPASYPTAASTMTSSNGGGLPGDRFRRFSPLPGLVVNRIQGIGAGTCCPIDWRALAPDER